MKVCIKCNIGRDISEFSRRKSSKDGLNKKCKECTRLICDHIFPISKFENITPIRIINALSNLQPLWAKDNLSKNNKIN